MQQQQPKQRAFVSLAETCRAWYERACALCVQVMQNHPWVAIVTPSMSNLPLTPTQVRKSTSKGGSTGYGRTRGLSLFADVFVALWLISMWCGRTRLAAHAAIASVFLSFTIHRVGLPVDTLTTSASVVTDEATTFIRKFDYALRCRASESTCNSRDGISQS